MKDHRLFAKERTGGCKMPWLAMGIVMFLILGSSPLQAGTSWLDTGSDLIQSLGKSSAEPQESPSADSASGLTTDQMSGAFKEALSMAAGAVVDQVGTTDGFFKDEAIHIPLPPSLEKVRSVLSMAGFSGMVDDLELKLNRAAEAAAPKALTLFNQSIREMTFADVKAIYQGPEDSATQYFRQKMSPPLSDEMRPIVENTLNQVGALQAYDNVMGQYREVPFVPDIKADLTQHVLDKGMDGIFYYMAREEAAIRENPLRQTTDLLKSVFGR